MNNKYVKFSNSLEDPQILFIPINEQQDLQYEISNLLNLKCSQCVEDSKESTNFEFYATESFAKIQKYFNTLVYIPYSWSGHVLGQPISLQFDFEQKTVQINGRKRIVVSDGSYTFKILKTKIRAFNGIYGFYEFVLTCMHTNSPFHNVFYNNVLSKL